MKQSRRIEFDSSAFAIVPDEDAETNPGIYGKALADWLSRQLRSRGLPTRDVVPEDFAWCIPVESSPHSLYVACASTSDAADQWSVFAFVEGGFVARLLGRDRSAEALQALYETVKACLEASPEIGGVREQPE